MVEMRTNPNRHWLSFSLRSLLIVVSVLCVGLGWKMHRVRNLRRAVAEVHRLGGDITYSYQLNRTPPVEPPGPKWLRQFLGDDFWVEVTQIQVHNQQADDNTLALIARLPRIDSLIVTSDGITDKGLAYLAQASELQALEVHSNNVTASGFANLRGLRNLMTLVLRENKIVGDSWMPEISKLTQVHYLYLTNTQVTDVGIAQLQGATGLREIDLVGTNVTREGVEQLRKSLPKCTINGP